MVKGTLSEICSTHNEQKAHQVYKETFPNQINKKNGTPTTPIEWPCLEWTVSIECTMPRMDHA
jgi:hypothetical protein